MSRTSCPANECFNSYKKEEFPFGIDYWVDKKLKEKVMTVYDYVIIGTGNDENASILAEGRFLARDMSQARTIIGQKNPGVDLTEATVQIRPFCE